MARTYNLKVLTQLGIRTASPRERFIHSNRLMRAKIRNVNLTRSMGALPTQRNTFIQNEDSLPMLKREVLVKDNSCSLLHD